MVESEVSDFLIFRHFPLFAIWPGICRASGKENIMDGISHIRQYFIYRVCTSQLHKDLFM